MVLNCVNSRNIISVIRMENDVIKIGKVSRENTMHSRKQWRRQILMSPERYGRQEVVETMLIDKSSYLSYL